MSVASKAGYAADAAAQQHLQISDGAQNRNGRLTQRHLQPSGKDDASGLFPHDGVVHKALPSDAEGSAFNVDPFSSLPPSFQLVATAWFGSLC